MWFDHDVSRLNYDARGQYLGEFHTGDFVLVVLADGRFYTTNFDANNHYEQQGILRIEKFNERKVWSAVLFDADQQGFPYVKRFTLERAPQQRPQSFLGENPASRFVLLTDVAFPRLRVTYGGPDAFRDPMEVEVADFIGCKSFKAKGKRLTTCTVESIEELEPIRQPEPEEEPTETDNEAEAADALSADPAEAPEPDLFAGLEEE